MEVTSLSRTSGLRVEVAQEAPVAGSLDNSLGKATIALLLKAPGFYLLGVALPLALFIYPQTQWSTVISHGFLPSLGKILRYQPGANPYQGHLTMPHLSSPLPVL